MLRDDARGELALDSPFEDNTVHRPGGGASEREWREAILAAGPARTARLHVPDGRDDDEDAARRGEPVDATAEPAAIPLLVTGAERITPPMLPIDVPSAQPGNAQE